MSEYKLTENLRRYRPGGCPGTLAMVAADEVDRLRRDLAEVTATAELLRTALARLAEPQAFYVATAFVDPETYARMWYAQHVLKGDPLAAANEKAEAAAREQADRRFPQPPEGE